MNVKRIRVKYVYGACIIIVKVPYSCDPVKPNEIMMKHRI